MTKSLFTTSRLLIAAIGAAMISTTAMAAPSIAGPSMGKITKQATFSGKGFAPSTTVTVITRSATGVETARNMLVGSTGRITIGLTPASDGLHSIRVMSTSGALLAEAHMMTMQ